MKTYKNHKKAYLSIKLMRFLEIMYDFKEMVTQDILDIEYGADYDVQKTPFMSSVIMLKADENIKSISRAYNLWVIKQQKEFNLSKDEVKYVKFLESDEGEEESAVVKKQIQEFVFLKLDLDRINGPLLKKSSKKNQLIKSSFGILQYN